jgi:sulfite reductase (ferredoxin)
MDDKETISLTDESVVVLKHHGSYMQQNRDVQRTDKAAYAASYQFMLRLKNPCGKMTPQAYRALDDCATNYGQGDLRATTRMAWQIHGVKKANLKTVSSAPRPLLVRGASECTWAIGTGGALVARHGRRSGACCGSMLVGAVTALRAVCGRQVIANIANAGGSTLGGCGDINRNVMTPPVPLADPAYQHAYQAANFIGELFKPQSQAFAELWLDGKQAAEVEYFRKDLVEGTTGVNHIPPLATSVEELDQRIASAMRHDNGNGIITGDPDEPLYGRTYLPRKFKIAVTVPGDNSLDAYIHDISEPPIPLLHLCPTPWPPHGHLPVPRRAAAGGFRSR